MAHDNHSKGRQTIGKVPSRSGCAFDCWVCARAQPCPDARRSLLYFCKRKQSGKCARRRGNFGRSADFRAGFSRRERPGSERVHESSPRFAAVGRSACSREPPRNGHAGTYAKRVTTTLSPPVPPW
jgi:hypothetical protein